MFVDYLAFGTLVALLGGATVVGLRRQRRDAKEGSSGVYPHDAGTGWLMGGGSCSGGGGFDGSWDGGGGFSGGGDGGGGGSGGHGG